MTTTEEELSALTPTGESRLELPDIPGIDILNLEETPRVLRMLVYGDQGSGKTYLSGTASLVPEMCPILYLAIEGGAETLLTHFDHSKFKVVVPSVTDRNGKIVHRHKWEHVEAILEGFRAHGIAPFKTIVIDSLSEAYELCMDWWLAVQKRADPDRDRDLPGYAGGREDFGRDYNKVRAVMRRMMRGYRDFDTHIIFTSHAIERKEETRRHKINIPAFPGVASNQLPSFASEVQYLWPVESSEKDEQGLPKVERRVQCGPTNTHPYCKSRGNLPLVLRDPTVAKIVELAPYIEL